MSSWNALALVFAVYLMLLGRSAHKQGELRQFLFSLGFFLSILITLAALVWGYIYWDTQ